MKSFGFLIVTVLSLVIACSAQAQLTVYDDFSGPFVDTARWRYSTSWGEDVWPFEGGFRINKGKLNFFSRAYGGDQSNSGTQNMRRQLFLRNVSSDVTTIEASIQLVKGGNETTACGTAPSETRVFIGGNFFNSGGVAPVAGNATDDVGVFLAFYRSTDAAYIPDGYMGVRGRVRHCTNADCSTYTDIYETLFDNLVMKLGKKAVIRIAVNKDANTITFQVGKKIVDTYNYWVSDAFGPGISNNKRIEMTHDLSNCDGTKSVGWADILVDYVSVD